jgi:hypothetical protein
MQNFNVKTKKFGYFCISQKTPKNKQLPNLVTLPLSVFGKPTFLRMSNVMLSLNGTF